MLKHSTWALDLPLLDYKGVDWKRVKRTRYFCYQRFYYTYPGPIRTLRQRLMVIPPDLIGDQRVIEQHLTVAPYPAQSKQQSDCFGNRIWELAVAHVDREIAFECIVSIERQAPQGTMILDRAQVEPFYAPSELTQADQHILNVAQSLAQGEQNHELIAQRLSDWIHATMRYKSGVTGVGTSAAQALAIEEGLCQDYSHIMLAMCRALGIPARYVSGHMLADGGSHAWVDVLVPYGENSFRAIGFDPTNKRRPDLSYAIVATGRDYRDVAPTSGSFTAPYGGRLSFSKRAGLTLVEYDDGEVLESAH